RVAFGDRRPWTVFANLLADVPSLQAIDDSPPRQERDQHRRNRPIRRTEGDVLKNIQSFYEPPILILEVAIDQLVKDVVNHSGAPTSCRRFAGILARFSSPYYA